MKEIIKDLKDSEVANKLIMRKLEIIEAMIETLMK
jgi:hypothetical protein